MFMTVSLLLLMISLFYKRFLLRLGSLQHCRCTMYTTCAKAGGNVYEISLSFATMRWTFRVLDMSMYIKRIQAHNVLMAKLQMISTAWPDRNIYQHALQWVCFSAKSFIYGYFDITISRILPKAAKSLTEIITIFLQ